ncbi:MAG: hypothetical protein ACK4NM_19570, partial [Hydrogenophaga sp.]
MTEAQLLAIVAEAEEPELECNCCYQLCKFADMVQCSEVSPPPAACDVRAALTTTRAVPPVLRKLPEHA